MCGITGWISYESNLTTRQDVLDSMTETMMCRGPDALGKWVRNNVLLGHRRLAVIDLPGGTQPMSVQTPHGSVVIVYSGEVYNFNELRDDLLALGHHFHTDSDTEVVLRGYLQWGHQVPNYLNGMFAFSIWDERHEKLLMVRDRMGIKPLYYAPTSDGVVFGSEPKAILRNPLIEKSVDGEGIRQLFTQFVKSSGRSMWKNIYEVRPGAVVTVDRAGIRHSTYWKLPTNLHTDDRDTTVATIRELLTDTVRHQLIADVPKCVLLSGGLDSSFITALAAGQLSQQNERLRTFSVDYVDHATNFTPDIMQVTRDAPYAHAVARWVDSNHHDVILDVNELADPEIRRTTIRARDMPGMGELDTSLYLLFKSIRHESTVALSGESADEVFGGYPFFHDANSRRMFIDSQLFAKRMAPDVEDSWLLSGISEKLDVSNWIADLHHTAITSAAHSDESNVIERELRTISQLFLSGFLRTLLDRKDRMSMAVGLEVRVPYCDHRIIEYVYNTPWSIKNFDDREKSLLRYAARDLLPQSVVQRQKSGYPSSHSPDYLSALKNQGKEILADNNHAAFELIDRAWLKKCVENSDLNNLSKVSGQLNNVLDLYHWFDIYSPSITLD